MRIITGKYGGRPIKSPKSHRVHPMAEKVRGALFNSLGDISGTTVLDAYGGSGAIAIEAISRGAKSAVTIEIDKTVFMTLQENVELLGLTDQIKSIRANCLSWSANNSSAKFDIIILDPPYDKVKIEAVEKLAIHLNSSGIMILSHPGRAEVPYAHGVVVVETRLYGDAALTSYRLSRS